MKKRIAFLLVALFAMFSFVALLFMGVKLYFLCALILLYCFNLSNNFIKNI